MVEPTAIQAGQPIAVPKIVYILFTALIDPKTSQGLLAVMANCATQGVKSVYLALSTPGGDVVQGMTLYNTLCGMPFELTTHNVGNVDSIGNAVFLAGRKRYACKHSTFNRLVNFGPLFQNTTNPLVVASDVGEHLSDILLLQPNCLILHVEPDAVKHIPELFREAQTKDAAFAVSHGIVDEIRDFNVPAGSTVISLVFQS
jgi:Clp protease